jgi:hypothetical protein
MARLSGWLVTDEEEAVPGADGLVTLLDTWFGDRATWLDDNEGLAPTLDETPGWSGWDSWNQTEKTENLRSLLETKRDRVVLIPPNDNLAEILTEVWQGDGWRYPDDGGLAQSLDGLSDWKGWESWDITLASLREWLTPLPAEWTGAEPAEPAEEAQPVQQVQPAPEVQPQPQSTQGVGVKEFINETDGVPERVHPPGADPATIGVTPGVYWARHHDGVSAWLPYDAPSRTWLDPGTGEWRPYERVGVVTSAATFDPDWGLHFRTAGDDYEYSLDGKTGWTADPYSLRPDLMAPPEPQQQPAGPSPDDVAIGEEESTEELDNVVAEFRSKAEKQGLYLTDDEIIEFLDEYLSDQSS